MNDVNPPNGGLSLVFWLFLLLLISFDQFESAHADDSYPQAGFLSNQTSKEAKFLQVYCEHHDGDAEIKCTQIYTKIFPRIDVLKTRDQIVEMAERDGFDLGELKKMCHEFELILPYLQGETVNGKTITPEKLDVMRRKMAADGLGYDSFPLIDKICKSPSREGVIDFLMELQKGEQKVCRVSSLKTQVSVYKLDERTGTYMATGVVNDHCDQYSYAEIIYPDERNPTLIDKYVEKNTFIQNIAEGEKRKSLKCDERDYSDKVFASEQMFFPLQCEGFTGW